MISGEGRFITFEGCDGAGKSSQMAALADRLAERGIEALTTREPGGVPGAEEIRSLLVTGESGRWMPITEALLLYAARAEHMRAVISPALAAGRWVLCDRFIDSTMAYQGYGLGLGHETVLQLQKLVVGDKMPDLTLIFDVPPDVGLERSLRHDKDLSRYERMLPAFHDRVRKGFLEIARLAPNRCAVIDSTAPVEIVAEAIDAAVFSRIIQDGRDERAPLDDGGGETS